MTLGVVGGSDLVKITEQLGKSGLEPAYTIKLVAPLCSSLQNYIVDELAFKSSRCSFY